MRDIILAEKSNPIVSDLAGALDDPLLLDEYLRLVWRIFPDPDGEEFIITPSAQIQMGFRLGFLAGDCDDAAVLAGAILAAWELPVRLVAIRMPDDAEFSHVYAETIWNGARLIVDPIVPADQLYTLDAAAQRMEIIVQ